MTNEEDNPYGTSNKNEATKGSANEFGAVEPKPFSFEAGKPASTPPVTPAAPTTPPAAPAEPVMPFTAAPGGSHTPPVNNFPPPPAAHNQHSPFPAATAPLSVETAYTWMYFLGSFGLHKYYLRQKNVWFLYPLFLLFVGVVTIIPVIGPILYLGALAAFLLNMYVDIKTMREQIARAEAGEEFTFNTQMELFKRVILKK